MVAGIPLVTIRAPFQQLAELVLMGQHYLPQQYLRHFAIPSDEDHIWMYDKQSGKAKRLPIKAAAQSPGFYTDEAERGMAQRVEAPAEMPLNRLRNSQQIDHEQRLKVAVYLESMLKRVPNFRRHALKGLKEDYQKLACKIRKDPEGWRQAHKLKAAPEIILQIVKKREEEIDQGEISIKDDIFRHQWSTRAIVVALSEMEWTVIRTNLSNSY